MYFDKIAPLIAVGSLFLLLIASLLRARSNKKNPAVLPQERWLFSRYLPIGATIALLIPDWVPTLELYIMLTTISVVLMVLFICIKRHEHKLDHYEGGSELLILWLLCTILVWSVHGLIPTQYPAHDVLLMVMPLPATLSVVGVGWTLVGLIVRRRAH